MKKMFTVLALAFGLGACNQNSSSVTNSVDSMKLQLDTLGEKIDTATGRVWDSTKAKARDLKESIEERLEKGEANDSVSRSGRK